MTPDLEPHRDPRRGRGRGARRAASSQPRSPIAAAAPPATGRPADRGRRSGRRPDRCRAQPAGPRLRRSCPSRGRRRPRAPRALPPPGSRAAPRHGRQRHLGRVRRRLTAAPRRLRRRLVVAVRPLRRRHPAKRARHARPRGHGALDARATRRRGSRAGRAAPTDTRIAYLSGSRLHVVAGDGKGDFVAGDAPAAGIRTRVEREPRVHPRLRRHATVASTRSSPRRAGSLWSATPPGAPQSLEWSSDGRRLLVLSAGRVSILDGASAALSSATRQRPT